MQSDDYILNSTSSAHNFMARTKLLLHGTHSNDISFTACEKQYEMVEIIDRSLYVRLCLARQYRKIWDHVVIRWVRLVFVSQKRILYNAQNSITSYGLSSLYQSV